VLGHADPGFTLRTYVHLLDAGVGDASFFDEVTGAATDILAVDPPWNSTTLTRSY
jgi:hypothetical protein